MVAAAQRPRSGVGPAWVRLECQACRTRGKAPASYAGRKLRCRGCGGSVRVPVPPAPVATTRPCPACAEEIEVAAAMCRWCGERLVRTKPCPGCAAKLDPTATRCRHCGEWVSAPPSTIYDLPMQLAGWLFLLVGALLALVLMALLAIEGPGHAYTLVPAAITLVLAGVAIRLGTGLTRRHRRTFRPWCLAGVLHTAVTLWVFASLQADSRRDPDELLGAGLMLLLWAGLFGLPIGWTVHHRRRIPWVE